MLQDILKHLELPHYLTGAHLRHDLQVTLREHSPMLLLGDCQRHMGEMQHFFLLAVTLKYTMNTLLEALLLVTWPPTAIDLPFGVGLLHLTALHHRNRNVVLCQRALSKHLMLSLVSLA